jgi:hypothetical protein
LVIGGAFTFHVETKKNKWHLFAGYLSAEFSSESIASPVEYEKWNGADRFGIDIEGEGPIVGLGFYW